MSRLLWYATPPHSQSVVCRAGKIAELGLIGLVHDGLAYCPRGRLRVPAAVGRQPARRGGSRAPRKG